VPPWRDEVLALLAAAGFDGLAFVPAEDGGPADPGPALAWEAEALRHADAILFWVPDPAALDARTAELFGAWKRSGKAVLGMPSAAQARARHLLSAPKQVPCASSLTQAVQLTLPLLRPGALRSGAERAVPLCLWRSPAFQRWYRALRASGNQLDDLDVEWLYRPRAQPGRPPLLFALRPRVWVKAERRHKAGEVVVLRADISATVLYRPAEPLLDTEIVLVREFRSAGQGPGGHVFSLPGGSAAYAADREQDPRTTAAREVEEETGLMLLPMQLEAVPTGSRQVAATILAHRAHLFRAVLSAEQMASLRQAERSGQRHGANPGERCYVMVRTLRELLSGSELDWGQVGMILLALGAVQR
jgi:8-oxo-dGTP pyrophosphatase MutT (NUDIX family)